ncbi:MAG: universal stress protein [Sandaracinaceae bacterium]|nr:universal stress protein [Sandaracinaceae bacterium]
MPNEPILVSLALDAETGDIVRTATELAKRMSRPLLPVHALGWRPAETEAHLAKRLEQAAQTILEHFDQALEDGLTVAEPVVGRKRPYDLVMETAAAARPHMIVTGGGGPVTIQRWVLGSTAERIVRSSPVPVFVARGSLPSDGGEVLCPVDLSAHSRVGLNAAIRMARLFEVPLRVLMVIASEEHGWLGAEGLEHELAREEGAPLERLKSFLAGHDTGTVEIVPDVIVGDPAERIVDASRTASLLVIGSRAFELLLPGQFGGVTERALRFSRCSALCVRDRDPAPEERERSILQIADLRTRAEALIGEGHPEQALPLLELAAAKAPANAAIQETFAKALAALGRTEEAGARIALARIIRESFG